MNTENDEQKTFWDRFSEKWVTNQKGLDGLMAPVLDGVLCRADLQPGDRVLDVGCGTGTSSIRATQQTAPDGHTTGIDISEPMLARARETAGDMPGICFTTADAAHYSFDPGTFDAVISRFGVMFFADPVTAFRNIRKAVKPGGRLVMATWSALENNPWFRIPMYAAKSRLGAPPPVDPDAPGPLAFRDTSRVCGILNDAGFVNVQAETVSVMLTPPGDARIVAEHAASIGPAARTMEHFQGTQADFAAIADQIEQDFKSFMTTDGARIPSKLNFFTAGVT